jgi:hypothetical protein
VNEPLATAVIVVIMQDAESQQDQSQMLKLVAASVKAGKPNAGNIKASFSRGASSNAARSGAAKRVLPEVSVAAVAAAVTATPEAQPEHRQAAPEPTDQSIDVEMVSADLQARNSKEKASAAATNKRHKTAGKQTAPRKSTKATAAAAAKAAEAAAEADTAGSSTDGGSDDEGDATATEAAAAADAACFTPEEVAQVGVGL